MASNNPTAGKPPNQRSSQRQLRVGELLRHRLSEVLQRADFEAKILKKATLSVTEVRVSADLRRATAYIMPLGGAHMDKIVFLLNEDIARLKKQALGGLHLKYTPDISFAADDSFARGAAMDQLLDSALVKRDVAADAADEAD